MEYLITIWSSVQQLPTSRPASSLILAQTSHRHRTDMCSMYDVGRITSKPHSVGGLPNSESGLEIQPVARATGQGGVAKTFARHLRTHNLSRYRVCLSTQGWTP